MTLPRQRLPGTTYFLTKVCDRFEFRLKPTRSTNAAFAVTLMEAANRHGIRVTAICAMSSHYHAVVFDPYGRLSDFITEFHALMARWGNARDGVVGCGFWEQQKTDTQVLGDAAAVVSKTAYCLANPTTSFVVERPEDWIGVRTRMQDLGTWRGPLYRRPGSFFDKKTWVSDVVELTSELPTMVEEAYGVVGFQERVAVEVKRLVALAHQEVRRHGGGFAGLAKVRRSTVWERSQQPSPRKAGHEAAPRKQVAAAEKGRLLAMLAALIDFRRAHRAALEALRRGLDAVFPAGTWKVWRFYGAVRASATYEWVHAAPA